MENSENNTDKLLRDGTVVVLLISALSFLFAYEVQVGYCSFFNIPKWMIKIDASLIAESLIPIAIVVFFSVLFEFVLNLLFRRFFSYYENPSFAASQNGFYYAIVSSTIYLAGRIYLESELYLIIESIVLELVFIGAFLGRHFFYCKRKREKSNKNGKEWIDRIVESENSKNGFFISVLGIRVILFVYISILVVLIGNSYGVKIGKDQILFYHISDQPNVVGITVYDGKMITKSLDDYYSATDIIDITNQTIELFESEEMKNYAYSVFASIKNKKKHNNSSTSIETPESNLSNQAIDVISVTDQ